MTYNKLRIQLSHMEQLMQLINEVINDADYGLSPGAKNALQGFQTAYQAQFDKMRLDLERERAKQ